MSRQDLDVVRKFLFDFAQLMLAEQGEFYPFAAGMTSSGEMTSVGADAADRNLTTQEIVAVLFSGLTAQALAGQIQASGICTDVRITLPGSEEQTDAICVELEHRDGDAIDVFLPYVKSASGRIEYGHVFSAPGEQAIFLPNAG